MENSAARMSPELLVRPSTKLLKPFYWLAAIMVGLIFFWNNNSDQPMDWLFVIPALLVLWTLVKHFGLRFTRLSMVGNRLRYESGILSKSTRTMELAKVQDVRVDQSLMQRMLGLGSISIETAGEASRLTMHAIDRPQEVADLILDAAHKHH